MKINSIEIGSLAELKKHLKEIYKRYPVTGRLNGEDDMFMKELMCYHPIHSSHLDEIKYFILIRQSRNTPTLAYVRKGSKVNKFNDCSCSKRSENRWKSSGGTFGSHTPTVIYANPMLVFEKNHTQMYKVANAFRNVVRPYLNECKRAWFGGKRLNYCQLSGKPILFKECSVHHMRSLSGTIRGFLEEFGVDAGDLDVYLDDNGYHLKDGAIGEAFLRYHNSHTYWVFIDSEVHDVIHSES
jgi:hypothetical protein